jgi:Zn-dependent protease
VFLIPLFSLLAAILLIVQIVQLRQIAAMPFARSAGRWVPVAPPAAIADLHASAETELKTLGFGTARWMLQSSDDAAVSPLRAVYVHAESATSLWLLPPNFNAPNRLSAYFVSRLSSGRMVISQAFDSFFEVYAGTDAVARTLSSEGLSRQFADHRALVAAHGSADPKAVTAEGLLAFNNDWMEQRRQALIAEGQLMPVSMDCAKPTLTFAWRLSRALRRMPKPQPNPAPVPPVRIALVAMQLEKIRSRSPERRVEFSLFAVSVALFMALGALFWDLYTAWIILVVIIVHELGHFLAMRAFGYRNVHMMALPLVGGVAIGQDVDPSAWRSAWMSLMGPLPGIVLGWLILIAVWTGHWPESVSDPVVWASIFLLLNYLNVLPVPPLDGGHVVQALLPPRRAWLEVAFIAVASCAGAWLAWKLDFIILAVLALLQLFSLSGRLKAQRALARLAADAPPANMARALRIRRVADVLDELVGATPHGVPRVNLALDVLQRLDRRPMRWWQSAVVASVFGVLLVVPIAAILVGSSFGQSDGAVAVQMEERAEQHRLEREQLWQDALQKSDAQLLSDLRQLPGVAAAPAVTDADLRLAEIRLNEALPEELAEWYRIQNGVPLLSLQRIDQLRRVESHLDAWFEAWGQPLVTVSLLRPPQDYDEFRLDAAQLRHWLLVSDTETPVLVNPAANGLPARVIRLWPDTPGGLGYTSMGDWLRDEWVQERQNVLAREQQGLRVLAARQSLAGASWPQILDALTVTVPFPYSLLADTAESPVPASSEALSAAARRLGVARLPEELIELLRLQNGVPTLQIGPVEEMMRMDAAMIADNVWLRDLSRSKLFPLLPGEEALALASPAELTGCWQLSGTDAPGGVVYCPEGHRHAGVIDVSRLQRYASLRAHAIRKAAQMQLANAALD